MNTMTRRTRVVALAGLTAATIGLSANATALPTCTTSPPSSAARAPGDVKSHTSIPWADVGTSWMAAATERNGTNTLALVSPDGQAYRIAGLAKNETIVDISRDGKHVMTSGTRSGPRVWDLTTATVTAMLPIDGGPYRFADRERIIATPKGHYDEYDVSGTRLGRHTTKTSFSNPIVSPDGRTVSIDTGEGVELHDSVSFGFVTKLPNPTGTRCATAGWQNAVELTTTCTNANSSQVYRQTTNADAPKAMTAATPSIPDAIGWSDAADTDAGRIALPSIAAAPDFVDAPWFADATKISGKVKIPTFNPDGGDYAGFGVVEEIVGNTVTLTSSPLGDDSPDKAIGRYDVSTKKLTYLVGNGSQLGGTPGTYATIDPRH